MKEVKYILFDAANTLIHKPKLWEQWSNVLTQNGNEVSLTNLKTNHKLVSELIHFPDRTDEGFYNKFNSELLLSLGIIPSPQLLKDIFSACSYLPWEKFNDTHYLYKSDIEMGVLSNFNSTLGMKLGQMFNGRFKHIFTSEELEVAKPNLEFYKRAIDIIGVKKENILYIGDSIKLDMLPALELELDALLIDRDGMFMNYKKRINSLSEIFN